MESPHPNPPPTHTSTALLAAMMSNASAAFKWGVCIAGVTCDTMLTNWRGVNSVRLSAGVKLAYAWGELPAARSPSWPSYSSPRKAVRPEASCRTSAPPLGCSVFLPEVLMGLAMRTRSSIALTAVTNSVSCPLRGS